MCCNHRNLGSHGAPNPCPPLLAPLAEVTRSPCAPPPAYRRLRRSVTPVGRSASRDNRSIGRRSQANVRPQLWLPESGAVPLAAGRGNGVLFSGPYRGLQKRSAHPAYTADQLAAKLWPSPRRLFGYLGPLPREPVVGLYWDSDREVRNDQTIKRSRARMSQKRHALSNPVRPSRLAQNEVEVRIRASSSPRFNARGSF